MRYFNCSSLGTLERIDCANRLQVNTLSTAIIQLKHVDRAGFEPSLSGSKAALIPLGQNEVVQCLQRSIKIIAKLVQCENQAEQ